MQTSYNFLKIVTELNLHTVHIGGSYMQVPSLFIFSEEIIVTLHL